MSPIHGNTPAFRHTTSSIRQASALVLAALALMTILPATQAQSIAGEAQTNDWMSRAIATGDFDGDGGDDIAVGSSFDDRTGGVNIMYSRARGIRPANNHQLVDPTGGTGRFGYSLVKGRFNRDAYDDLAVGAPGSENVGEVVIYLGGPGGLNPRHSTRLRWTNLGVNARPGLWWTLGHSLAAGRFHGGEVDGLAIGAPRYSVGSIGYAGAVIVVPGFERLYPESAIVLHQDQSNIGDVAEVYDWFGYSVAAGDFNGDDFADLAVGVPLEGSPGSIYEGIVHVFYGSFFGLMTSGSEIWHQDTSGIGGVREAYDYFGMALTTGDFNGDGADDLVVGVWGEDLKNSRGNFRDAGAVQVIYGGPDTETNPWVRTGGLTTRDFLIYQDLAGIAGTSESGDELGASVTAGDFDGDGLDDLAIGVPGEAIGSIGDAGLVNVVYADPSGSGLTTAGSHYLHQHQPHVPGSAVAGARFAQTVAAGRFVPGSPRSGLLIGAPFAPVSSQTQAGLWVVQYPGSNLSNGYGHLWHQDR